jgi:hypothetical protein
MKKRMLIFATFIVATGAFAQKTDTIKAGNFVIIKDEKTAANKDTSVTRKELNISSSQDTITVGNFVIIKKDKGTFREGASVNINTDKGTFKITHRKTQSNVSTNWFIFDLGFTNVRDNTNYAVAQTMGYLNPVNGAVTQNSFALNSGKSSNVNIWFFMQKLNISQHILNLKYGLGLEMYNFRYDRNISYRNDPYPNVYNDVISFSKNKLFAEYLTIPLMLNVNTTPHNKKGFSFSVGASAGYLIASKNKQISGDRGKQKYRGTFDLQPWRFAAITELGLGPVRVYGSYSLNALHKESTGLEQFPYAVGIRFSNW